MKEHARTVYWNTFIHMGYILKKINVKCMSLSRKHYHDYNLLFFRGFTVFDNVTGQSNDSALLRH